MIRKAITIKIDEEGEKIFTLIKPIYEDYLNMIFVLYEDIYGDINSGLISHVEMKKRLKINDTEYRRIIGML